MDKDLDSMSYEEAFFFLEEEACENAPTQEEWTKSSLKTFKGCDEKVIKFIGDVRYHAYPYNGNKYTDDIRRLFESGYCYYFAVMLKEAFQRGTICNVNGRSHIVWVDGDVDNLEKSIAYDIDGVYYDYEPESLIPVEFLGDIINGFKHVEGLESNTSRQEVEEKVNAWKNRKRD